MKEHAQLSSDLTFLHILITLQQTFILICDLFFHADSQRVLFKKVDSCTDCIYAISLLKNVLKTGMSFPGFSVAFTAT